MPAATRATPLAPASGGGIPRGDTGRRDDIHEAFLALATYIICDRHPDDSVMSAKPTAASPDLGADQVSPARWRPNGLPNETDSIQHHVSKSDLWS